MTRKREQSDMKIDLLIDDALNKVDASHDDGDDNGLDELSVRVEERLNAEEPGGTPDSTGDSGAHDDSDSDAIEDKPTLDSILAQVDSDAKSKVGQAEELDNRRLTFAVNPIIRSKASRTKEGTAKGWLPFCLTIIIVGIVWAVIGFCTGGSWPIPLFGWWNMACGCFLVVYGGLMLLNWR